MADTTQNTILQTIFDKSQFDSKYLQGPFPSYSQEGEHDTVSLSLGGASAEGKAALRGKAELLKLEEALFPRSCLINNEEMPSLPVITVHPDVDNQDLIKPHAGISTNSKAATGVKVEVWRNGEAHLTLEVEGEAHFKNVGDNRYVIVGKKMTIKDNSQKANHVTALDFENREVDGVKSQ